MKWSIGPSSPHHAHRAEMSAVQTAIAASSAASNEEIEKLNSDLVEMEKERDKLK